MAKASPFGIKPSSKSKMAKGAAVAVKPAGKPSGKAPAFGKAKAGKARGC